MVTPRPSSWRSSNSLSPSARRTLTSADPEDLTLRQARLLGEADVLLIDGDVPPAILARTRADAAREPIGTQAESVAGSGAGEDEAENPAPGLTLILRWRPAPPEPAA